MTITSDSKRKTQDRNETNFEKPSTRRPITTTHTSSRPKTKEPVEKVPQKQVDDKKNIKPNQQINTTKTTTNTKVEKITSQKLRNNKVTARKTSLKSRKRDSSTSSSSTDEEVEGNDEIDYVSDNDVKQTAKYTTHENIQDENTSNHNLLPVIVQHPKSSRESSPDHPKGEFPLVSASEDGDMTPRYADFVIEPEDVEVFDEAALRGPRRPIPSATEKLIQLVDSEDETKLQSSVSVNDRKNKFLEAVKSTKEFVTNESDHIALDTSKNVSRAKLLFENIAKGQPSTSEKPLERPEPHTLREFLEQENTQSITSETNVRVNGDIHDQVDGKEPHILEDTLDSPHGIKRPKTVDEPRTTTKKDVSKGVTEKVETLKSEVSLKKSIFERKASEEVPKNTRPATPLKRSDTPREDDLQRPEEKPTAEKPEPSYLRRTTSSSVRSEFSKKDIHKDSQISTIKEAPRKSSLPSNDSNNSRPTSPLKRSDTPREESTQNPKEKPTSDKPSYLRGTASSSVRSESTKKDIHTENETNTTKDVPRKSSYPINDKTNNSAVRNPSKQDYEITSVTSILKTNKKQSESRETSPKRTVPTSPSRSPTRKMSEPKENNKPDNARNGPSNLQNEKSPLNKTEGKFGVTLRQTTTTTTTKSQVTSTPKKRPSLSFENVDIEQIFDLEILEEMLLKATVYEERRRIRAQIRVVKKMIEEELQKSPSSQKTPIAKKPSYTPQDKKESVRREPTPEKTKTPLRTHETTTTTYKTSERLRSSPERSAPVIKTTQSNDVHTKKPTESEVDSLTRRKDSFESRKTTEVRRSDVSEKKSKPKGRESPEKVVQRKIETRVSNVTTQRDVGSPRFPKTESAEITSSTVSSSRRIIESESKVVNTTDSITSSYGVGPTDENGRPLFGLKALKRTKTIDEADGVKSQERVEITEEEDTEIRDSSGKPLFGLKALRTTPDESVPAQSSSQLRELVERHQQYVRGSTLQETHAVQKPKAKLRDTFIQQSQDEMSLVSSPRPNSVGVCKQEMASTTTVTTSHSVVSSDGKVSMSKSFIRGEVSSKNGEEPVGRVIKGKYTYDKADEASVPVINKSVSVLTNRRRSSGPKIEEITDVDSVQQESSSRRSSREYSVEEATSRRSQERTTEEREFSTSKFSSESTERRESLTSTGQMGRKPVNTSERLTDSSSNRSQTSSKSILKNSQTETSQQSSTSTMSSANDETPKKTLVRGDSIKALQHKFQQATVSSSMKQVSNVTVERRGSNSKGEEISTKKTETTVTTNTAAPISGETKTGTTTTKVTTVTRTSPKGEELKRVTKQSSESSSFLDNSSKVTGVQDILNRMRNADLGGDTDETTEDAEARSLLNKFLGASVILQGMEQGMRAGRDPIAPSSAALVRQAEKQRVQSTSSPSHEDYNNITDEKQLRILLEACSDYELRGKLRARLHAIMTERGSMDETHPSDSAEGFQTHETVEMSSSVDGGSKSKTEVHSKTTTSVARLTKANSVQSPFAKFRQLERQNSAPSVGCVAPVNKFTPPMIVRGESTIKERLLNWVQAQTRDYKNVQVDNFSTSWSNGLAFCALIHHFCPDAFDYDSLTPDKRRYNFTLAFKVAEEKADIYPLLDVEDMVTMRKPDWKCVFTYVQSFYQRFHDSENAVKV